MKAKSYDESLAVQRDIEAELEKLPEEKPKTALKSVLRMMRGFKDGVDNVQFTIKNVSPPKQIDPIYSHLVPNILPRKSMRDPLPVPIISKDVINEVTDGAAFLCDRINGIITKPENTVYMYAGFIAAYQFADDVARRYSKEAFKIPTVDKMLIAMNKLGEKLGEDIYMVRLCNMFGPSFSIPILS